MKYENKIKKFIDCYVPVTTCNLRCHYCYITQQHKFDNKLPNFENDADTIGRAFNAERFGGICCINFCGGGETLLPKEMPLIMQSVLAQGHFVMCVTNGTVSNRFDEIITMSKELLSRLFFKFSFHYLELVRLGQLELFFDNIAKVRQAGCSFSLEITPSDELIPYIDEIKKVSLEYVGALPHITVARDNSKNDLPILTKYDEKEYSAIWDTFNSELFSYKMSVFNKKQTEFCYAGAWSYYLDLCTGELKQCYQGKVLQYIYSDLNSSIIANPMACKCKESHCYNAHAWLTWGDIPSITSPSYLAMRDRQSADGTHWCLEPVKSFFQSKLQESNAEYSTFKKMLMCLGVIK